MNGENYTNERSKEVNNDVKAEKPPNGAKDETHNLDIARINSSDIR